MIVSKESFWPKTQPQWFGFVHVVGSLGIPTGPLSFSHRFYVAPASQPAVLASERQL
jgi:hypothetical protein